MPLLSVYCLFLFIIYTSTEPLVAGSNPIGRARYFKSKVDNELT
jgi:hypothetical protein